MFGKLMIYQRTIIFCILCFVVYVFSLFVLPDLSCERLSFCVLFFCGVTFIIWVIEDILHELRVMGGMFLFFKVNDDNLLPRNTNSKIKK